MPDPRIAEEDDRPREVLDADYSRVDDLRDYWLEGMPPDDGEERRCE